MEFSVIPRCWRDSNRTRYSKDARDMLSVCSAKRFSRQAVFLADHGPGRSSGSCWLSPSSLLRHQPPCFYYPVLHVKRPGVEVPDYRARSTSIANMSRTTSKMHIYHSCPASSLPQPTWPCQ
jgi:hypothetical protein